MNSLLRSPSKPQTRVAHSPPLYARFMSAMKRSILTAYAATLLLAALFSGCARPEENSTTSTGNAAAQANSNSASQANGNSAPGAAGALTPSGGTPLSVQQLPATQPNPPNPATQPAAKPATDKAPVSAERAPKLVAPEKRVNFGKQPQDKDMIRAITISNGGKADLKIESVVPS